MTGASLLRSGLTSVLVCCQPGVRQRARALTAAKAGHGLDGTAPERAWWSLIDKPVHLKTRRHTIHFVDSKIHLRLNKHSVCFSNEKKEAALLQASVCYVINLRLQPMLEHTSLCRAACPHTTHKLSTAHMFNMHNQLGDHFLIIPTDLCWYFLAFWPCVATSTAASTFAKGMQQTCSFPPAPGHWYSQTKSSKRACPLQHR